MGKLLIAMIVFIILVVPVSMLKAGGGGLGGGGIGFEDITEIHLTVLDGEIREESGLSDLESGFYDFKVTNKTGEKIVFLIHDLKTDKVIRKTKIKPSKQKSIKVKISSNGFQYKSSVTNDWVKHEVN